MNLNAIAPINVEDDQTNNVVIETPKGSEGIKYRYNEKTDSLEIKRIFKNKTPYPFNYGFIPNALAADGKPLEVILFSDERLEPLSIVRSVVIGSISIEDQNGTRDQILSIPYYSFDQFEADIEKIKNKNNEINNCSFLSEFKDSDLEIYSKKLKEVKIFLENQSIGENGLLCKVTGFDHDMFGIFEISDSIDRFNEASKV